MTKTKTMGIIVSTGLTGDPTPFGGGPSGGGSGGGGTLLNHAEGIVVTTGLTAGSYGAGKATMQDIHFTNHAEGIVVSTEIVAGLDSGRVRLSSGSGVN